MIDILKSEKQISQKKKSCKLYDNPIGDFEWAKKKKKSNNKICEHVLAM